MQAQPHVRSDYTPRQQICDHEVVSVRHFETLGCNAVTCRHLGNHAEVIHFYKPGSDNYAAMVYYTPTTDHSGWSHVVEHCKTGDAPSFNLHQPFFQLRRTNLFRTLNAATSRFVTAYHFSTPYSEAFDTAWNLYGDFSLNGKAAGDNFLRERGHLVPDGQGGWMFSGVVFDEMRKSSYNPTTNFHEKRFAEVAAGTPYQHVSGGDPNYLRELDEAEVGALIEKYYHPSNSITLYWGPMSLESVLQRQSELVGDFEYREPPSRLVTSTSIWDGTTREVEYATPGQDAGDRDNRFIWHWKVPSVLSPKDRSALHLLQQIYSASSQSPFKSSLDRADLSHNYRGLGIDDVGSHELLRMSFQGGSRDELKALPETINRLSCEIADGGLSKQYVQTLVRRQLASIRAGAQRKNVGAVVLESIMESWGRGRDPFRDLDEDEHIRNCREHRDDPDYWSDLVRRAIVENSETIGVLGVPETRSLQATAVGHLDWVTAQVENSNEEDLVATAERIDDSTRVGLISASSSVPFRFSPGIVSTDFAWPQAGSCVIGEHPAEFYDVGDTALPRITTIFSLNGLEVEELCYLQILCEYLEQGGTSSQSSHDFLSGVYRSAYALALQTDFDPTATGAVSGELRVGLVGLDREVDALPDLLSDLLFSDDFSKTSLEREILARTYSNGRSSIYSEPLDWVRYATSAFHSDVGRATELLSGVSQYKFVKRMVSQHLDRPGSVLERLQEVHKKILSGGLNGFRIVADAQFKDSCLGLFEPIGNQLSRSTTTEFSCSSDSNERAIGLALASSRVCYTGCSVSLGEPNLMEIAIPRVAMSLLRSIHLTNEVRHRGRAYGVAGSFGAGTNTVNFYSSQDVLPKRTLEIFRGSGAWLRSGNITQAHVDEAARGILADLVSDGGPVANIASAAMSRRSGFTDAHLANFLKQLPVVTLGQIQDFGDRLTHAFENSDNVGSVVSGDPEVLTSLKDVHDRSFKIDTSLMD